MPTALAAELHRKASMLRTSCTPGSAAAALLDDMHTLGFRIADRIAGDEPLDERAGACKRSKVEPHRGNIQTTPTFVPFSTFGAWRDSRAFYERAGSSAWSEARDQVPCLATSNSYVAACLARAALAFHADVAAADPPTAKPRRLVILEAGAGHAALTFLMATFLRDLRAEVSVLLLATDCSERLMTERSRLPCFAPLLWDPAQRTQLVAVDFCAIDVTEPRRTRPPRVLIHSRVPLEALRSEGACFFHVCCYLFDSLPADLYLLRSADRGRCETSELGMPPDANEAPLVAVTGWQQALVRSDWSDTALGRRYAGIAADAARAVADSGARLPAGHTALRILPVGAIRALKQLRALSASAWAVAVVDTPHDPEGEWQQWQQVGIEITPRPDAFALALDFDAVEAAINAIVAADGHGTGRTWRSARAMSRLALQVSASGAPFPRLGELIEKGALLRLSFSDFASVMSVAERTSRLAELGGLVRVLNGNAGALTLSPKWLTESLAAAHADGSQSGSESDSK
jgi:hypothetical protein